MRVRLTDGTHEVDIKIGGRSRRRLGRAERTALRILDTLRATADDDDQGAPHRFGFTGDDVLDGTSLDSSTERAEPYDVHGEGDE